MPDITEAPVAGYLEIFPYDSSGVKIRVEKLAASSSVVTASLDKGILKTKIFEI